MTKQLRTADVKIHSFSKEGFGLGMGNSPSGQPVEVQVPFSMPGDEVRVQLFPKRKGVYQSRPLEFLHLSENRSLPRCKHFGQCGGCRWQHLKYEDQLKQKEMGIQRLLQPLTDGSTLWHPIIPCTPPWQYRNKMELSFSSDKKGDRYLGLILQGTRGHVFQMEECHLMHEWVAKAVHAVSGWWEQSGLDAYHLGCDKGSLRTLTLREGQRTGDRLAMLTVSGNPDYALNQKQLQSFISTLRESIEPSLPEQKLSIFLRIQQIAKGRPTQFYEMQLYGPPYMREILHIETAPNEWHALSFRISPSAFFQPNTFQAEKVYSKAIQLTQGPRGGVVYDLYCGTGTLGICMAKHAERVIGIELSPESSLDALENIKENGLTNMSIQRGDVGDLLPVLLQNEKRKPDVVLVDPPRAGLDSRAMEHLIDLKAPLLTYISCNPATQAANLAQLVSAGYKIRAVQPVDQFPHTIHVENIVALAL